MRGLTAYARTNGATSLQCSWNYASLFNEHSFFHAQDSVEQNAATIAVVQGMVVEVFACLV